MAAADHNLEVIRQIMEDTRPVGDGILSEAEQEFLIRTHGDVKPRHLQTLADQIMKPGFNETKNMFWGAWRLHFYREVLVIYRNWLAEFNAEQMRLAMADVGRVHPLFGFDEEIDETDDPHVPDFSDYTNDDDSLTEDDKDRIEGEVAALLAELDALCDEYDASLLAINVEQADQTYQLLKDKWGLEHLSEAQHQELNNLLRFSVPPLTAINKLASDMRHQATNRFHALFEDLAAELRPDYINSTLRRDYIREFALPNLTAALCFTGIAEKVELSEIKSWVKQNFVPRWNEEVRQVHERFAALNQRRLDVEARLGQYFKEHPESAKLCTAAVQRHDENVPKPRPSSTPRLER